MQRYTIFFINANALRVSGSFPAHHQELKNCTHSIWYMPSLLAATASVGELELTRASHTVRITGILNICCHITTMDDNTF